MKRTSRQSIACTGYLTSVASYVLFLMVDALRPGFVARYFSVHIFLLAAILFGIWWVLVAEPKPGRAWSAWFLGTLFGILFAMVTWSLGTGFHEYRVLVTALAFFVPFLASSSIRS